MTTEVRNGTTESEDIIFVSRGIRYGARWPPGKHRTVRNSRRNVKSNRTKYTTVVDVCLGLGPVSIFEKSYGYRVPLLHGFF